MGRLRDKLTGTAHPRGGVVPRPAEEVRAALLAAAGPQARFTVREATPKDGGADLVAECLIPALDVTLRTRMRLDAGAHAVRVLEERWAPTSEGANRQYGRGPSDMVYRQWEFRKAADGSRQKVETFRFSTRDMRVPLQKAVLGAGWTWRGVLFRL
ncbi:hypothetical protein ABZ766_18570 [Streptomyces sp. NPDC006670]|uniref:hypothetical protein n=1 Tax=Streptomyces sp. NPDC006670 TaxID=3154476 RepID=UPI0033DE2A42